MLKKLLLLSILGFASVTLHAMQTPAPAITYEGPQPTADNAEVEINAKDEDNFARGWIVYNFDKPKQAEITLFEVEEEARNLRIGQTLFQKFINDTLAHKCTKVTWTVNPVSTLDTKTLCAIYEKIVKKLENSQSYELSIGDPYGPGFSKVDMTLVLQKNKLRMI